MKQLEFIRIKIEGFGSIIEPLNYTLNKTGLNIIAGVNGVGKTTIPSALCWAAYGKTLKKSQNISPWKSLRNKNYKGTKVTLYLASASGYLKVIRCKDYRGEIEGARGDNRLVIYLDNELKTFKDKNEAQAWLSKELGKSFDLFKNSIIFGQKLKRIIQEDGSQKKKIFEEAFEATFINTAKEEAQRKLAQVQEELGEADKAMDKAQEKKDEVKRIIAIGENFKGTQKKEVKGYLNEIRDLDIKLGWFKNQKEKLKEYAGEIKSLENKLLKLPAYREKLRSYEMEFFKAENRLRESESVKKQGQHDLKAIANDRANIKTHCHFCKRPLDKESLKKVKAKFQESYNNLSRRLKGVDGEIEMKQQVKNKIESKVLKYKNRIKKLEAYQKQLNELLLLKESVNDKKYHIWKSQKETYTKLLNEAKSKKNPVNLPENKGILEKQRKKIKVYKSTLKTLKKRVGNLRWAIDKVFSNSGLKAYIFKDMLKATNLKLEEYFEFIGFRIEFGIDLDSARKDFYATINNGKEIIDYEELSGGQQQLVDVCIIFAINETINENNGCNILIMDEVFESLDPDNIEVISQIIKRKARNKIIHLITHRELDTLEAQVVKLTHSSKRGTTAVS